MQVTLRLVDQVKQSAVHNVGGLSSLLWPLRMVKACARVPSVVDQTCG